MKILQFVSFIALALSVILWTAGRIFFPLPDWAVRGCHADCYGAAGVFQRPSQD